VRPLILRGGRRGAATMVKKGGRGAKHVRADKAKNGDDKNSRYATEQERIWCAGLLLSKDKEANSDAWVAKELKRKHNCDRTSFWVHRIRDRLAQGYGVRDADGASYHKRQRDSEYDHTHLLARMKDAMGVSGEQVSYVKVAEEVGCSESTARRILEEAGYTLKNQRVVPPMSAAQKAARRMEGAED